MVKVVLDTNVWISAIFFKGRLSPILNHWEEGKFTTVFSENTFTEVENKLELWGKKLNTEKEVAEYLHFISQNALFVYPQVRVDICEDPDDNKLLEAAQEAKANYLVSGDKKVLKIGKIGKTKIISPKKFLIILTT